MFEHTGSRWFPFNLMLNLMTPLSRKVGPEMNRPTVENVRRAGFRVREVRHIYLDVVKTITAQAPAACSGGRDPSRREAGRRGKEGRVE